ncbi:phospholipid scramblase 3-like [Pyxicephalus adspersus]|uniref:phospholipid scramblase 3-like n=1 Tax=Pyxicephalus adspersus TaxID=30357 RepID=UPI003B5C4780
MAGYPVVPPGLEFLPQVSELYVKQTRDSVFQNYCTYDLFDATGQLLYKAVEQREFCGPRLDLIVSSLQGYVVLHLLVPSNFCSWETKLQVSSSSGEILGYIEKNWTSFSASFDILDPSGGFLFKVKGPGWGESFMSDAHYRVFSSDTTTQIAVITRVWRGFLKEMLLSKDAYSIPFPLDLYVNGKVMLLACTLFIDLLYEENKRNERSRTSS